MAQHEKTLGPLYFCHVRINRLLCPPHRVQVTEMDAPWRRGSAILLPIWLRHGLVLGLWRKKVEEDIQQDFEDDQWFSPKWLSLEEVATAHDRWLINAGMEDKVETG